MGMRSLVAFLSVALIVALWPVPHYAAQQPTAAPTAEQIQAYEAFRLWITKQPVDVQRAADPASHGPPPDATPIAFACGQCGQRFVWMGGVPVQAATS